MAENTREQRRRKREYEARQVVHDVQLDRRRTDNIRWLIALAAVAVLAIAAQIGFAITGGQQDPAATTAATEAAPKAQAPDPAIAEDREWTGTMPVSYTHLTLPTICSV